jgi:hypothetical protein
LHVTVDDHGHRTVARGADSIKKSIKAPLINSVMPQRPALRGFVSTLPAALQPFERQPAFLHDCAFRAE